MPAPEILSALRIVASPRALDRASWPTGATVMRLAEDEALLVGADEVTVADPHAIIAREHGYCGVSMPRDEFDDWFSRHAPWRLPTGEPAVGQGAVAGLPIKVWADRDRALVITRTSLRHVLQERL